MHKDFQTFRRRNTGNYKVKRQMNKINRNTNLLMIKYVKLQEEKICIKMFKHIRRNTGY